MSGAKTVVALIDKDGAYIDSLNPLPTTGGGGGGAVTQGAGSGVPTSPWTTRISNGTAFIDPLTDAQLRASAVPVSLASLPLPTNAATETTLAAAAASLTSIDGKLATPMPVSATALPLPAGASTEATLVDVKGQQTDGTQRSRITDGTNNVTVSNTAPAGTEYGLAVRPVITRASTSSVTSPVVTTVFASILAANSSAKLRIFYNGSSVSVGLTLGGSGAVTPGMVLAPGQTWVMPQGPDGFAVWTGVVNATVSVGTTTINVTEIT